MTGDTDLRLAGLTLRQTCTVDLGRDARPANEPKDPGGEFYQKLRAKLFEPPNTPLEREVEDARLLFDDLLVEAACAPRPQHPDRPAMSDDLQTSAVPNQSEIVCIVMYFLSLKSRCAVLVVGSDDKSEIHRSLAVRMTVVIADVLEQSLVRSRSNHTPDDVFARLDLPVLSLIMYLAKKVVAAKNSRKVSAKISRLVASRARLGLEFSRLVASSALVLLELSSLVASRALVRLEFASRAVRPLVCRRQAEDMMCIDLLLAPAVRGENSYREQITVRVLSSEEQEQLALVRASFSVGVETKQFCELESPRVENMLVPETSMCRWKCQSAGRYYACAGDREVPLEMQVAAVRRDLVLHAMVKVMPTMLSDPTFDVEIAIVEKLLYETAQRILNAVVDHLLSLRSHPETSAQKLPTLANLGVFELVDRSSQAKVAQTLINSLVDRLRPIGLSEVNPVLARLP